MKIPNLTQYVEMIRELRRTRGKPLVTYFHPGRKTAWAFQWAIPKSERPAWFDKLRNLDARRKAA